MTPYERESQVYNLEQKVSEYPDIPPEEKAKPLMRMLQFIGGIINIPSSAISGLAYQLLDKKPGIGAKEYLKFVFGHDGFQEQGTWSDVIVPIGILLFFAAGCFIFGIWRFPFPRFHAWFEFNS